MRLEEILWSILLERLMRLAEILWSSPGVLAPLETLGPGLRERLAPVQTDVLDLVKDKFLRLLLR